MHKMNTPPSDVFQYGLHTPVIPRKRGRKHHSGTGIWHFAGSGLRPTVFLLVCKAFTVLFRRRWQRERLIKRETEGGFRRNLNLLVSRRGAPDETCASSY